jgi:uncharacterized protein (TIGR03067 family)
MKHVAMLSVFGILCLTACVSTSRNKNDAGQLSGAWSCVSATIDGKTLPPDTVASLRLTLTENQYKTQKGTETLFESTYSVDPSKSPKQINMIGTEGDLAGKEAHGIYSLEGDILRICYTMPDSPRPDNFESAPGSKAYLIVWRRDR